MLRLLLFLILPLFSLAQTSKKYQGLLWKISGNGLEKPSYLYGTMHVSNKVAFHLGKTFFNALDSADIIALETNPEYWVRDLTSSKLYHDFFEMSYGSSSARFPLYKSFIPREPKQTELEYYLSRDQDMLNSLLYRESRFEHDFEENTFLDLFIFQAGKKSGKKIVALEDYQESFKSVLLSGRQDKDAIQITERQAKNLLGNFNSWEALLEDAYRKGDLDLLDTINSSLYPGKYHRKYMLDIRNRVMVKGMDSLMQTGVLFTGIGASHLPGDKGVINLLRQMGYTVEPENRFITSGSMDRKEIFDTIIYKHQPYAFRSDDNFITAIAPGKMTKFLSHPYQEYVFADMVNGGFYSIRRVSTFGPVYGKDVAFYQAKIDSLLFENIPGKILSKTDTLQVSGFPAYDIVNKTRQGDYQRYKIVFTPLEILIFKVGGHKEFALSAQPEMFFNSIVLHPTDTGTAYSPRFKGFRVQMPGNLHIEKYEAAFFNPHYTFWTQSVDSSQNYYAVGFRQFYDFDYLEEDNFELRYLVKQIGEEKKLIIDTLYLVRSEAVTFAKFRLSNKKGFILHGEVHLRGPKYVLLLTRSQNEADRNRFFRSFSFTGWHYPDIFREYTDSVLHVTLTSPKEINNYESFLKDLQYSNYTAEEDHSYRGHTHTKTITYEPTGEQLQIQLKTLHRFRSYTGIEEFWNSLEEDLLDEYPFGIVKDSILYTKKDSALLTQAREYSFADSASRRIIRCKMILENGAVYSLYSYADTLGYFSEFADQAFETFRPSGDTIIGSPVTSPKAGLFFEALASRDSTRIFEARNSIYEIKFENTDATRIKDIVLNYRHPQFDREARLNLLNRLSWLNDDENIPFLEDLYYRYPDSSAYQFKILETLADFKTKKSNRSFLKLILDEPPFTSNYYSYNNLMGELDDSLNLARDFFPDLLALTEFTDYRNSVYSLLADLVDSGYVKPADYREKYQTILRFAKVELKKQRAADEKKENPRNHNSDLLLYNRLLTLFAQKKEVREHYTQVLQVRNKQVLAHQLTVIDPFVKVPDSIWNYIADDPKAFYSVYEYLRDQNKLNILAPEFQSKEALAKAMVLNSLYRKYDTVSFIKCLPVEIKPYPAMIYFFRARKEDDKLWQLLYTVVEDTPVLSTDYALAKEGESYNESIDDLDEIIDDALKEIEIYGRLRALSQDLY